MCLNEEWYSDLLFGILAVILMGLGETGVVWQLYSLIFEFS